MLVKLASEGHKLVHLHLHGDIVVRNVLLRVSQSLGNDLSNLTVLEVFICCCS